MRTRVILLASLCVLALGACGGDPDPAATTPGAASPTSESPLPGPISPGQRYTSGTATAEVTGGRTESFEAALDPEAQDPGFYDEDFVAVFTAENGWHLRFSFTPVGVGPTEDDFVEVGIPGGGISDPEFYYDRFEECETTLTQFDSAGVAGTYTCIDLPNAEEPDTQTIDVQGTFSVTP